MAWDILAAYADVRSRGRHNAEMASGAAGYIDVGGQRGVGLQLQWARSVRGGTSGRCDVCWQGGDVDVGEARRLTAFVHARGIAPDREGTYTDSSEQVDVDDGTFELRYLPAEDYVLEFATGFGYRDRWFYPGVKTQAEATMVHVDDGKATELKFVVR